MNVTASARTWSLMWTGGDGIPTHQVSYVHSGGARGCHLRSQLRHMVRPRGQHPHECQPLAPNQCGKEADLGTETLLEAGKAQQPAYP